MLKKIIGLVFLFCFAFSLDGEARQSSTCHPSAASKKIKRPTTRKKRDATVIRKKRPHRVATGRKRTQRVSRTRNRSQRVSRVRTRSQRASRVRARPQLKRRRSCQPVSIQLPPPTYLSKLKPQTQRNAQLGGFNRLYNKNLYGQGIAAVIEYSGGWHEIHSIKQGGGGFLLK